MTFKEVVNVLLQSVETALTSVLKTVKKCGNLGFYTYTQLYNSSS